jgi:putative ABC transport system ATP-binding protein
MMIEIKNLNKAYNLGEENGCEVLKGINLTIHDGEMTAIMGASGAGKSTLLHILSCIDQYDNGEYLLDGELIGRMGDARMAEIRNEKMGIVMQDFALIEDFTALENVMMPLDFSAKKRRKKEKRNMALEALEAVSMKEYAGKPVCKLSGGQKQRVAIARGLVNRPEILFADEPTGALDSVTSGEIMKLLRTLNEKGTTMVIVTHDRLVAESCDRIIKIVDGRVQDIA